MTFDRSNFDNSSTLIQTDVIIPTSVKEVKKKNKKTWLLWLLLFCLLGGGGYAIARATNIISTQQTAKVPTVPVEKKSLPVAVSANGTVKPERSINVSPKTSGVLKTLLVQEGDTVTKGQVIAYMDDSNLQGQLIEAKGQLASAQANLQQLVAGNRPQDIAQAQASLDEARANLQKLRAGNRSQDIAQAQARLSKVQATLDLAEDDLNRHEELYQAGAISRQTLNQKRTERDTALAEVTEARQALALQQAGARPEDIAQAEAVVKQKEQALSLLKAGTRSEEIDRARAQVSSALGVLRTIQTQIDDTKIVAPFDGVVSKKFADPGAFVAPTTAGSEVSSATSSSILALTSANQVVADVAESNIAQIRVGQKVEIQADAYPGKTFEGKVTQIAIQATVEQNVASFEVKIAILSDTERLLLAGMNADVDFQVGRLTDALLVPTAAIARQENATGVYVLRADNKLVFTPIETGVTADNKTEVKSGLDGSEKISLGSPSKE